MKKESIGIYLHSPFCGTKCGYCSFYSFPGSKKEKELYLEVLHENITQGIHSLQDTYKTATIYFGGGTPSSFSSSEVCKLLQKAQRSLHAISDGISEVTVEVNPADYSSSDFQLLRSSGVTRLSVGIQSLSPTDLKLMGRRHSLEQAFQTIDAAINAGFPVVSVDLIYGLPGQEFSSWRDGLQLLFNKGVNHLSVYELTLEEGTPFYDRDVIEPHEERIIAFLEEMLSFLYEQGFSRYEISNYAKGSSCRSIHNLNYWRQQDYLGFGPSAVSTIDNIRRRVASTLDEFLLGHHSIEKETLTDKQVLFERIMLGLRSCEGVAITDVASYQNRYLTDEEARESAARLAEYLFAGYLRERAGRIFFTDKGFLLYNEIISKVL